MRRLLRRIKRKLKRELRKAEAFLKRKISSAGRWMRQLVIFLKAVCAPELSKKYKGIFEVGTAADVIDDWDKETAEIGCWGKEALITLFQRRCPGKCDDTGIQF